MTRGRLLIAGAARSGTTTLAGLLSTHPDIDASTIKEPNFYAVWYDRGEDWYRSLYSGVGRYQLDASAIYTYPRLMNDAFRRMNLGVTDRVIYIVRQPIERAFSHFCQEVIYQNRFAFRTFADALMGDVDALDASRYDTILPFLYSMAEERLLLLPFEAVTKRGLEVRELVLRWLDLDPLEGAKEISDERVRLFANERARISNPLIRSAFHRIRHTKVYPRLRAMLGPERMRAIRGHLTTTKGLPALDEGLTSCTAGQRAELADLTARCASEVRTAMAAQDLRLGTNLLPHSTWV